MRVSMEHMEMDTRILNTAYTASKMDSSPYPQWKSRLKSAHRLKDLSLSKEEAVQGLHQYLPTLKRWMKAEDKASWILGHTGYVTLSTIDEEGFPRSVAIDVIAHYGIKTIWMTTFRNSNKARQLMKSPKAGISFVHEADSVTLTGIAEVITDSTTLHEFWKDVFIHYYPDGPDDENYCLIRFTTRDRQ